MGEAEVDESVMSMVGIIDSSQLKAREVRRSTSAALKIVTVVVVCSYFNAKRCSIAIVTKMATLSQQNCKTHWLIIYGATPRTAQTSC